MPEEHERPVGVTLPAFHAYSCVPWATTRLFPYSWAGRRAKRTGISRCSMSTELFFSRVTRFIANTKFPTCSWPICWRGTTVTKKIW
jgi:hypothetical protein